MIRKTLVSPLKMGSPGRDSLTDRSVSPIRRGSVQSRNSLRRGSRAQPVQILADYRAIVNLRKALTNKFGSLTTVFAFSVLLGGFDRKLMIRPILTSTIPPSASLAKQEEAEVESVSPPQLFSSNRSRHRNRMKPLNRESKMLSDILSLLILQKMLKLGLKLQGFLCGH
jgi:hypothetical protein